MSDTPSQYPGTDPQATGPLPQTGTDPQATGPMQPLREPALDVSSRMGANVDSGNTTDLSWGARTDVGLVREHNEDSFLVRCPLFCVCDGMGGHAAGEVASSIAVGVIAAQAPSSADDALLGAAVEAANEEVIKGAEDGRGKPGMGCTATAVLVEGRKMAIAHVGDSRVYLLHAGTLVRVTHDHSFVEELVDSGEITADEARIHPSRSIITRALGSDPDMYADHFTLDVEHGDRIIICSDGLSSMVPDALIEETCVTQALPQECVDALVAAALEAGGHDNITVVVVDVVDDGSSEERRKKRLHGIIGFIAALVAACAVALVAVSAFVSNSWYVGNNYGTVAIYQGVNSEVLGIKLSSLAETTSIQVSDLPSTTQKQLSTGIVVASDDVARSTVESYRDQIDTDKTKAVATADDAKEGATTDAAVTTDASTAATSTEAAATQQQAGGE
ncbi:MAG: Stp1/IreP family PP2C-type Ser/Thr phosphatase [Atopobiaceae bacterium]|jgi:protein phosphatase|nr:Stp1/IreP family PP2C-type Ser/Thr phosphatase [Atopobiaceae bacterium]MCH4181467.1 Stp1/IreP family PP2C-type Ser/Thr phosphatase [Atopobiaceae bacterium]MCH4214994.1 Stp1/IreP family PP2C-type Ser/Thr phosphatase [Atopobiaceae bacterium]MCH4230017.1 Stp1/IreP family PP2C-type Ser/Thr phosphatase [Atopobiaceae bacterium]MCH4277169.1 Stp1/IreP family PP2C-type Ser/Thr phosphatase [Atopobiaceae bacterium]